MKMIRGLKKMMIVPKVTTICRFSCAISVILVAAISGCSNGNWSDDKVKDSQVRGDRIASALNQHYTDKGSFPATLEDLVPDYIQEIEPPLAGNQRWKYNVIDSGSDFTLIFEDNSSSLPTSWRKSQSKRWSFDTK